MLSVSDQLLRLRKKLLWTRVALAVMMLLAGFLCFAIGRVMIEWDAKPVLGQNYTVEETTNPAE